MANTHRTLGKVRPHPTQNEALLFEKSSPGKRAYKPVSYTHLDVYKRQLFATIPAEYRLDRDLEVPRQQAESEIIDYFRAAGKKNSTEYASFLGAGAYRHYRPVIIDSLVQRGEFLTSYTPYQAEITQGTQMCIRDR